VKICPRVWVTPPWQALSFGQWGGAPGPPIAGSATDRGCLTITILWHVFTTNQYWNNAHRLKTIQINSINQTVNDGVAHSKNPRKFAYHVTFDLDLDLEHILDARWPGVHLVKVWWRSGHLPGRISDLRKSLQTDGRTDRRRTPRRCISSFLEWAKNGRVGLGQGHTVLTRSQIPSELTNNLQAADLNFIDSPESLAN